MLIRMLKRENELRLSKPVNNAISKYGHSAYGEIMGMVQGHVASEFGFEDLDRGIMLIRCAESLYANDAAKLKEIREVSYYRKYNRCMDGNVMVDKQYPALPPLYECNDSLNKIDLFDTFYIALGKKPLVLLAGSYS